MLFRFEIFMIVYLYSIFYISSYLTEYELTENVPIEKKINDDHSFKFI